MLSVACKKKQKKSLKEEIAQILLINKNSMSIFIFFSNRLSKNKLRMRLKQIPAETI